MEIAYESEFNLIALDPTEQIIAAAGQEKEIKIINLDTF